VRGFRACEGTAPPVTSASAGPVEVRLKADATPISSLALQDVGFVAQAFRPAV